MTPERWRQVEDILARALELVPEERADLVASACGEDLELRREVESLLAQEGGAPEALGTMVRGAAAALVPSLEPSGPAAAPGKQLGFYRLVERIGIGGMGELWKAVDTRLDREVAIKVLPQAYAADEERLRRFEKEARAVGSLNHPNILTLYELATCDGVPFLVMELLEGWTLRERLPVGGMPQRRVLEIGLQIARGLTAAHEKGVVHRDLKPENIWITRDGRVKILDFGLAKLKLPGAGVPGTGSGENPTQERAKDQTLTRAGMVIGTVAYMSPEQASGDELDGRSDLFSLGVVLWELLTGRRPFQGVSNSATLKAILNDDPPELPPELKVQPMLERVLHGCLAKEPARRFHSAHDLAFALESITMVTGSGTGTQAFPRSWRRRLQGQGLAALLGAGLLVSLATTGWMAHRMDQVPPEFSYKRLTFRRGNLSMARFSPDGNTIIYSAGWDGQPTDLYQVRLDSLESRPLGLPPGTDLLAVSSKGELAVRLKSGGRMLLARVPLMGGTPREILEDARWADWSPDGSQLAVLHLVQGGTHVEYPIGTKLYETGRTVRWLRVSPQGDRLAIIEEEPNRTNIQVISRDGSVRTIPLGADVIYGLAWAPEGDRLVTSWGPSIKEMVLGELFLDGTRRILARGPSSFYFSDCGPGGRMLVEQASHRQEAFLEDGRGARDVSWLEGCQVSGLAGDGSVILSDEGEGSGPKGGVWMRRPGAGDPLRLCDGNAIGNLSPDGRWVPVLSRESPPRLTLVPTGPGQARELPLAGVTPHQVLWQPGGRQLLVRGLDGKTGMVRIFMVETGGGDPRVIDGLQGSTSWALAPDAGGVIGAASDGSLVQARLDGSPSPPLPFRLEPGDRLVGTSGDGRSLYVANTERPPFRVDILDLPTGKRRMHRMVARNALGARGYSGFVMTPDGSAMAYSVRLPLRSDLYLMEGRR
ncbi:MAG: protein kinase [Acidobacteria bacterium]|nr:protein kinase [Acidobacteriota bacterium]